MYSVIIKKNKDDHSPFGLNEVLKEYIDLYGKDDIIVVSPGYRSTTEDRIKEFCDELSRIAPHNTFYFAVGMNGARIVDKTGETIHKIHTLKNSNIKEKIFGTTDHSKFWVFLDKSLISGICHIKAVALGSSNVSANTFCSDPAPKGEADVLLIEEGVVDKSGSFQSFVNRIRNPENKGINGDHSSGNGRSGIIFSKSIFDDRPDEERMKSLFPDFDLSEIISDLSSGT